MTSVNAADVGPEVGRHSMTSLGRHYMENR